MATASSARLFCSYKLSSVIQEQQLSFSMSLLTSFSKLRASELFGSVLDKRTDMCGSISDADFRTMICCPIPSAASSVHDASGPLSLQATARRLRSCFCNAKTRTRVHMLRQGYRDSEGRTHEMKTGTCRRHVRRKHWHYSRTPRN
jgi:hypothetical protein